MKTHWNHRVVRKTDEASGEVYYGVHEVYYEDGKSATCTVNPVAPFGETADELREECARFVKSFEYPTLDFDTLGVDRRVRSRIDWILPTWSPDD